MRVWVAKSWLVDENGQPSEFERIAGVSWDRAGVLRFAQEFNRRATDSDLPRRLFLRLCATTAELQTAEFPSQMLPV